MSIDSNKVYLEFAIGPSLYNVNIPIDAQDNFVDYSAIKLLKTRLGLSQTNEHIYNKLIESYNIVIDTTNYMVTEMEIQNIIKFITVNNRISAIILNLNDIPNLCNTLYRYSTKVIDSIEQTNKKLYEMVNHYNGSYEDRHSYIYNNENNEEYWKDFITKVYDKIINSDTENWQQIEINQYAVMSRSVQIGIYGKQDENRNILIGFNINSEHFNYFSNKPVDKTIEDIVNKVTTSNNTIHIESNNKKYIIETSNTINGAIKLLVSLISSNKINYFDSDLRHLELTKDCIVLISENQGIYGILIKENSNIQIEYSDNTSINIDNLIRKMKLLGINRFSEDKLKNLIIFSYIPEQLKYATNNINEYNYLIYTT